MDHSDNKEAVDLARWQGMIDERTRSSVDRLDAINGDVREIKLAQIRMEALLQSSIADRDEYMPLIRKLASSDAVADGVAKKLTEGRALGLTRLQMAGGVVGLLLIAANVALRLAGVDGL